MNILVFGDSITQGFFDEVQGGWCNRLAQYAMKKVLDSDHEADVAVFNLGISGDCTNRLLKRFDVEAGARTKGGEVESTVVFAIGINDTQRYVETGEAKTSEAQFKKNLELLYEKAQKHTKRVVFVGITPIIEEIVNPMPWANDRSHTMKDVETYNQMIEEFCKENDCLYVPMEDVFDDVGLKEVIMDGVHPNSEGHEIMFVRIKAALEKGDIL